MKEYRDYNGVITNNNHYIVASDINSLEIKPNTFVSFLIDNNKVNQFNLNIKENANVNIYLFISEEKQRNFKSLINLEQTNARCNFYSVVLGKKEAIINSNVMIKHLDKATSSNLKVYAISNDNAKLNLDNNAHIIKGASKSSAIQSAKGLTLSSSTSIKAQPNLFIDEYDVAASHGVAMGSLNKDDLFYLMSRGLSYTDASKIVTMGFIEPFLKEIDNSDICEKLRNEFIKFIE